MTKLLGAAILAVALCVVPAAATQDGAELLPRPLPKLRFPDRGVDWDKVNPREPDWAVEARLALFLERWMHLPERLERFALYGSAIGAGMGVVIVGLVGVIVWQGRKDK